jgi:hypothetical protein
MIRGLEITAGIVTNAANFKSSSDLFEGWIEAPASGANIGWTDNGDGTFSAPVVEPPVPTQDELDEQAKRDGFTYNSVQVPVTNADAVGAMQIKTGFDDYGMQTANFHLSNGEILPLTLAEWPTFAAQFFAARAAFF